VPVGNGSAASKQATKASQPSIIWIRKNIKPLVAGMTALLIAVMMLGWISYEFQPVNPMNNTPQAIYFIQRYNFAHFISVKHNVGISLADIISSIAEFKPLVIFARVIRIGLALNALIYVVFLYSIFMGLRKTRVIGCIASVFSLILSFVTIIFLSINSNIFIDNSPPNLASATISPSIWVYLTLLISVIIFICITIYKKEFDSQHSGGSEVRSI